VTQGATHYGENPTDPTFFERNPTINHWIAAVCGMQRAEHGRTLEDIAGITRIQRPVISTWQQPDGPTPRDRSVIRFCEGLGIDPEPVLLHYGYIEPPERRRSRKVQEAMAVFEEILSDQGLPDEERFEYERRAHALLAKAMELRKPTK
jgi:transcriptional regulator with XRE-family HTH domain